MLEELKEQVYQANMKLHHSGLVISTWGNVSGVDRSNGVVAIKPSGVEYELLSPEMIVLVDLESGSVVEGSLKPSSDTPTHIELYQSFEMIGGITHTHSLNATSFAQAGKSIPALGTTQADYFWGDIPCTRALNEDEVKQEYELNTGKVIVETFLQKRIDPIAIPGALVKNHGPFAWGKDAATSVFHAIVIEQVAAMAFKTILLNPESMIEQYVLDKHYSRKHGAYAYYGQE